MRAAVLEEYKEPLEITDVERPTVADHGAVIELDASGICRSDWKIWQNEAVLDFTTGMILGHEPAGTVVEVGDRVESVREGDEVAVPLTAADGTCSRCRDGHTHLCEMDYWPGAWAEEIHVPHADVNAIRLPDTVSSREMAGLGCRFITSFHALAHKADVEPGDWVAVHGCGGVGLSAVDIASALGGLVVAVDLQDEKLEQAEELGAVATVNADDVTDIPGEIRDITDGGADVSIDALGSAKTSQNSVHCLDYLGQHLQIGGLWGEGDLFSVPTRPMHTKEIEFIRPLVCPPTRVDEIFPLIDHDRIHPAQIISKEVALDDVNDRLRAMTNYETNGIEIITEF